VGQGPETLGIPALLMSVCPDNTVVSVAVPQFIQLVAGFSLYGPGHSV
jgi:hypothetical protein